MSWLITGAQKVAPTVWDPNFLSVSLLLHGNGTNGSTTFTDNSPTPKTVTAVGNSQISTAQSKFGGASIAFDGTGDYLTSPFNSALHVLGSDFTLELWVRLAASQNNFGLFSTYTDAGSNVRGYIVRIIPTGLRVFAGKGGSLSVLQDNTYTFSVGQWYHIAVTSQANTGRVFIDGTQQGGTIDFSGTVNSTETLQIGRTHTATDDLNGFIDDLRITRTARYTANFTPPTAPFPDI
jgi:hypothetical protein